MDWRQGHRTRASPVSCLVFVFCIVISLRTFSCIFCCHFLLLDYLPASAQEWCAPIWSVVAIMPRLHHVQFSNIFCFTNWTITLSGRGVCVCCHQKTILRNLCLTRRYLCSYFCGSARRAGLLVRLHLYKCVHCNLARKRIPYHHMARPSDKLGMLELALKTDITGYAPLLHARKINCGPAMAKRIHLCHGSWCCYFHASQILLHLMHSGCCNISTDA